MTLSLCLFSFILFAQNDSSRRAELISDFYQSSVDVKPTFQNCDHANREGNCTSIALVKAALGEFKTLNNIYKEFKAQDDSFYFRFNDNIELSISKDEIELADNISGIKKDSKSIYYDSAMIIFTSICKRVFLNKGIYSKCIVTFRDAIDYIDCGFTADSAYTLLGLRKREVNKRYLSSEASAIIHCAHHTAYCSYGYQDNLGNKYKINKMLLWMKTPVGLGERILGAYMLIK
jgi:hypothetical protein